MRRRPGLVHRMRARIWPEDALFSKCVREAAAWTCVRCHTVYPPNSQGLHASHYFGRRHQATRFLGDSPDTPQNVFAHCFACHQYLGERPDDFRDWVIEYLDTADDYVALQILARAIVKRPRVEKKDIRAHFRAELGALRIARANGFDGPLQFKSWP